MIVPPSGWSDLDGIARCQFVSVKNGRKVDNALVHSIYGRREKGIEREIKFQREYNTGCWIPKLIKLDRNLH